MTSQDIQTLARAIADEQMHGNGAFYVLWLLITIAAAGVGAWAGSYLKRRGENYATKQDFEALLNQVKATTEATTQIKTQIEHADWTRKEAITVKRQKAEAFLDSVQDVNVYLDTIAKKVFFQDEEDVDPNPARRCNTLAVLYFPEATGLTLQFCAHVSSMSGALIQFRQDLVVARVAEGDVRALRIASSENFLKLRNESFQYSNAIEFLVANLMADMSGVARPYPEPKNPHAEKRAEPLTATAPEP